MLRAVDRVLAPLTWLAGLFVVVLLIAGPSLIGAKRSAANAYGTPVPAPAPAPVAAPGTTPATTPGVTPTPTPAPAPAPAAAGAAVFASAGCANCHTLKAANASGTIGPNLDSVRPNAATVAGIVRSGGGAMPSFAGKLSDAQIQAVAQYVASVAGR